VIIINKKEYDEKVNEFLKMVDKEINQWGIYKSSPEMQKRVKKNITDGLVKLPELQKKVVINKLLESGIFTPGEIDKALKIPIEKRKLVNVKELLDSDIKPEPMIIGRGLIPDTGGFVLIGGKAKEGKTLLALQLGLSLVSGEHFLEEFPVIKKSKVVYVYHENTLPGLNTIIKRQLKGLDINIKKGDLANFHLRNGREFLFTLKNPTSPELGKELNIIKPDVVFLDPLSQFLAFDINKAEKVKKFIDNLRSIRDCVWVLIHHERKPARLLKGEKDIDPIYLLLGSSYLANACESSMGLVQEGENYSSDYKKIYFKLRRENIPLPLHLKRDPIYLNYEVIDSVSVLRGKISKEDIIEVLKNSLQGRASFKDIAESCSRNFGVSEERVAKVMRMAKEAGVIAKEEGKRGAWYLVKDLFS